MRHRPIAYTVEDPSGGPLRHVAGVNDIVPSFRPGHFISAGRDCKILEWKLPTTTTAATAQEDFPSPVVRQAQSSFSMHGDQVNRLLPLPGYGFLTAGADNVINMCQVQEQRGSDGASYEVPEKNRHEFSHHSATIKDIALLGGDGGKPQNGQTNVLPERLIACCADNTISVLSLHDPQNSKLLHTNLKSMAVCCTPTSSNSFYVGCLNGTVQSVDVRSRLSVAEFIEDAHSNIIRDMTYFKERMMLVTAGSDSLIRVWDTRNVMDPVMTLDTHGDAVWRLQRLDAAAGALPGFCSGGGGEGAGGGSGSSSIGQCVVSAGREGTLQAHDILEMKTTLLAQCSYPILSFHLFGPDDHHAGGGKAVVGTPASDIVAFNVGKIQRQGGGSGGGGESSGGILLVTDDATPSGKGPRPTDASPSQSLTPSAIRVDFGGGGGVSTKLPHQATDDAGTGSGTASTHNAGLLQAQQFQLGVAAPYIDLQEEQPVYRSPFKPARTESREHTQWASFNEASIPRPPTLPAPAATFAGGIGFIKTAQFPTRMHAAVARSDGTIAVWDVVNCRKVADLKPGVRFSHVVAFLESLPALCGSWCSMSCNWGCVSVSFTDTDGSSSNPSEWELEQTGGRFYTDIIMDALSQMPAAGNDTNSSDSANGDKNAAAVTATVAATAKERVVKALLSRNSFNTNETWSLAMEPVLVLRAKRLARNINLWAIKRIVLAAREGRMTKFLVRNLPCHHQEGDRRALYELPLTELSTLPINEGEFNEASKFSQKEREREATEEKNRMKDETAAAAAAAAGAGAGVGGENGDDDDADGDPGAMPPPPIESPTSPGVTTAAGAVSPGVTGILMHHRRAPRWLILHANKSDILKASATVPNAYFTCDPFTKSDPPSFGKILPAAFADKKPPLQLPRTSVLAELCHYIVKAVKKTPPTFNQVQDMRAALKLPLLHRDSAVIPTDDTTKPGGGGSPSKSSASSSSASSPSSPPGSRPAEPEEWILLFNSSGGILDPSITVGLAYSLFRQKDERNLTIKYSGLLQ